MRVRLGDGAEKHKNFAANIDEDAVVALHGKHPPKIYRGVKLTGTFGKTGQIAFRGYFGFDAAIVKADCDVIIAGRLQRFAAEVMVNPGNGATAWRPDVGWCPMLMASMDVLQLQGRPGDTWTLGVTMVERPPDTEHGKKLLAEGRVVPCAKEDGEIIDCSAFYEDTETRY